MTDPQKGGTIANWDSTFALVLGNEVSGDRSWQGLIKFVAIHNRALTAAQVMQNFNAGVGQRYYLLFNVSAVDRRVAGLRDVHGRASTTATSYLFYQPTFISLDPDGEARPASPSRACASASTARSRRSARPTSRSIPR